MQLLTAGKGNVIELAFAPDGLALAATFLSHVPALWELPVSGEPVRLADKPTYSSRDIVFSANGAVLSWLSEQTRHEFDRRTGVQRTVHLAAPAEGVNSQAVCGPDGRLILRTVERGVGFRLRAFVPDGRDGWAEAWPAIGPSDNLSGWEMAAPAANHFFTWEGSHWGNREAQRLFVRSSLTGTVQHSTATTASWLSGLATPPDGSIVVGYNDSSLYAWRPGGKVEKVRTGTLTHYRALAFHPDGRHLLAGNNDTTARLIDSETWQIVRQYTWAIGRLTAMAVSPDGMLAAAGGAKGKVVVWDLDV